MVEISGQLIRKLYFHGERTYPEECCGVLLGQILDERIFITEILELENTVSDNRERRFLLTAEQYRQAELRARDEQRTLLGFYHSHPDHPARPSQFDTDHALPWFLYLIFTVSHNRAENLTAWRLEDDRSRFAEVKIDFFHDPAFISTLP